MKYLADLLKPYIGEMELFVCNMRHFTEKIQMISLKPHNILVSFDVASLLSMVLASEVLGVYSEFVPAKIRMLFCNVLTTIYSKLGRLFFGCFETNSSINCGTHLAC